MPQPLLGYSFFQLLCGCSVRLAQSGFIALYAFRASGSTSPELALDWCSAKKAPPNGKPQKVEE
jgi:hypothetical protein